MILMVLLILINVSPFYMIATNNISIVSAQETSAGESTGEGEEVSGEDPVVDNGVTAGVEAEAEIGVDTDAPNPTSESGEGASASEGESANSNATDENAPEANSPEGDAAESDSAQAYDGETGTEPQLTETGEEPEAAEPDADKTEAADTSAEPEATEPDANNTEATETSAEPEVAETGTEPEAAENGDEPVAAETGDEPVAAESAEEPEAAESDVDKPGTAAGDTAFPPLEAENDQAYVTGIKVTEIVDGTSPWDSEQKAGNDTGANNKIVRSFDSVSYKVSVGMAANDGFGPFGAAHVRMEFVLPVASDVAEFDTAAMGWMDESAGYKWSVTTETRTINGVATACQVLNCYNYLYNETDTVIPGEFSQNVVVKVKAAANGQVIQPQFTAGMECCDWSEVFCEEHQQQEKWTTTGDPVVVTAAPKYNVSLKLSGEANTMWKGANDYNTGNTTGDYLAANYGIGSVYGRTYAYGVTIMLYNDNASKGMKGIELPKGPITFDLTLSSSYNPDEKGKPDVDVSNEYAPLLWGYGPSLSSKTTSDGRQTLGTRGMPTGGAPYANATDSANAYEQSCYDSGDWKAEQDDNTISVTVSNYEINTERFPDRFIYESFQNATYGKANVGMFSAGEIWIQQPFNKINSTNTSTIYDVVNDYGSGTFTLTVDTKNLSATSLSGKTQTDPTGTNGAQMNTSDDHAASTVYLTVPGNLTNRVYYSYPENTAVNERGVDEGYTLFTNGKDATIAGADVMLVSGFYYQPKGDEENQMQYATSLEKFDGSAIKLTGTVYKYADLALSNVTYNVLYAAKPDGSNWINDNELKSADEDDLIYYPSLGALENDGKICVATLAQFFGPSSKLDSRHYKLGFIATVENNQDFVGEVLMLHEVSRLWTAMQLDDAAIGSLPSWLDGDTKLADFPEAEHVKNPDYTKESYNTSGAIGTHAGNWELGDSLLIIGYKTSITKNLAQKSSGTEKNVYNMDQNQRTADFVLQPSVSHDQTGVTSSQYATITIEDTLPKHLTYLPGSAYTANSVEDYVQTSTNGGTQGIVTNGVLTPPTELRNNDDGTQTLIWRISEVKIDEPMKPIFYSVAIGTPGQEETDVPIATTNLTNKVRIYSKEDMRDPSLANLNYAESGLRVVRGSATSFAKFTTTPLADSDGIAKFTVLYANNSSNPETDIVLMDTMPYNEDPNNLDPAASTFSGSYTVSKWQLEANRAPNSSLELYFTTDESYRGKTAADVTYEEVTTSTDIASDGISTDMNGQTPVAWVVAGDLAGNETVRANIELELECGGSVPNAMLVNKWSTGTDTTTSRITLVSHSIEGLVWKDINKDGQQDTVDVDGEERFVGVQVTLLQLRDGGDPTNIAEYAEVATTVSGKTYDVNTGEEADYQPGQFPGRYRFTGLPNGTFAVKFDNSGETKISPFIGTVANTGDDTTDSDGITTYNASTGLLAEANIIGIVLPEAKDMVRAVYESRYNDLGLYEVDADSVSYSFTKISGTDTNAPLAGAEFSIYKSTHVHDESCGGLSADDECSFVAEQLKGDVFDAELWDTENPVYTAVSGEDGIVTLSGLSQGVYMLVETKAPEGYELSRGCWIIDVDVQAAEPITITGSSISPTAVSGQPNAFITQTVDGKNAYYLPNYEKPIFPVAGGVGTYLFTFAGLGLIDAAAIYAFSRWLKKRREDAREYAIDVRRRMRGE